MIFHVNCHRKIFTLLGKEPFIALKKKRVVFEKNLMKKQSFVRSVGVLYQLSMEGLYTTTSQGFIFDALLSNICNRDKDGMVFGLVTLSGPSVHVWKE